MHRIASSCKLAILERAVDDPALQLARRELEEQNGDNDEREPDLVPPLIQTSG
jgi:hypothetical protein